MGTKHRFSPISILSLTALALALFTVATPMRILGFTSQDGGISSGFDFDREVRNDEAAQQTDTVEETPISSTPSPMDIALKSRLDKLLEVVESEPYTLWYAAVKMKGAENASVINDSNWPGAAVAAARIAKCAALVYALQNDRRMLDSFEVAFGCLERANERAVVDNQLLSVCNIAQDTALALLFVRSRLAPNDDVRKQTVKITAGIAEMLYKNRPEWYDVAKNNWGVRQYSALLTCALVLENEPAVAEKAKVWREYCETELPKHIDYQRLSGVQMKTFDGWAEGHSYLEYSFDTLLDCVFAVSLSESNQTEQLLELVAKLSRWSIASSVSDGSRPNFDDSFIASYPSGIIAGLLKKSDPKLASLLIWDFTRQNDHSKYKETDPTLALLTFDSEIAPVEPRYEKDVTSTGLPPEDDPTPLIDGSASEVELPTTTEPEYYDLPRAWYDTGTGDMVIRSGWESDDSYFMMRTEGGNAHWRGAGHEHWDPLSVMFYVGSRIGGEWLLLDGGYLGFDKRQRTNTPDNHNVLLVNKFGADWTTAVAGGEVKNNSLKKVDIGVPGYTGGIPHGFVGGAETKYRDVKWRRDVLFVKRDFVLIRDRIEKIGQSKIDDLRIPWHINANTHQAIEKGKRQAQVAGRLNSLFFELPSGEVSCIEWASSAPVTIEFRTDNHAFKQNAPEEHWVAEVIIPVSALQSDDAIYPVENPACDVFPKGGFTMYTLVGNNSDYLANWDPPESAFNVISEIWAQTYGG